MINKAAFATISSDGFKDFLPNYEYIHIHSLNMNLLSKLTPRTAFQGEDERIRITFIGNIRFFDINKEILNVFKNDCRFQLCYYGTNAEVLEDYCRMSHIENVSFHSSFQVEKTCEFIEQTDMINNIYGNHNKKLDYALSIKLYYGIYNRVPILVNSKTYMEEKITKYNIGYVIDTIEPNLPDKIYDWYSKLNFEEFSQNCQMALNDIELCKTEFEKAYQEHINL